MNKSEYKEALQKLLDQGQKQLDQFVSENAALDLASLNKKLGELRRFLYIDARKEYEKLIGEDDGNNSSENSGESSDESITESSTKLE